MAEKVTGYCVKCKKKNTEMIDWELIEMENGRDAVRGKCKKCGTGMYRILSAADAEKLSK